jgi:tetratricopeptide (TPR) repeat protein/DNA-binding transcriptional regulator YiaG
MPHIEPDGQKRARPNPHLKVQRARLGLTQQEVAEALAALAWEHDHEQLGVDADMVSKWERGAKRPRRLYRRLLCMLYNSTEEDLGLRQTQGGAPADDFSGEDVNRREFLRAAVVAPEVLRRVLRGAGGEAMEFTRMAGTSGVGAGTFDHLEAVLTELRCSFYEQPPAEQFAVARAYRTRVQELIQGRHTFREGQQLYVYAALFDEMLTWLANNLGDGLTADAYAIDCFEHADQAGHNELCAWAADQMASIAIYANRPERAARAARKGIERAPAAHPVGVRLHAQAARAHARLGERDEYERSFTQAQDLYDRLPSRTPVRFGEDTRVQADHALSGHPASSHIWLADFKRAKGYAEKAVALHEAVPVGSRDLGREAIARIDLGIALAELGEADEAIGQGQLALASPRVSESVRSRAADLDAVLTARYPQVPAAQEFHEQYGNLVRATR